MNISDKKLYALCKKYGHRARLWRQKFAGLLPEVLRRKLYEKKGFSSIFEFAAKLAGMSHESVRLVLNLERRFEDKPKLKELLVNGEVSINKLARVVSIATPENQDYWAEQAKILPKGALETLIKDSKFEGQDGFLEAKNEAKGLPGQNGKFDLQTQHSTSLPTSEAVLNLSPELTQKLLGMQAKGIDINALLFELLKKYEIELAQEKERLSSEVQSGRVLSQPSRYIPAKIRNFLKKEHGNKCSLAHCARPATTIHHTQRFALSKNHDPRYLAPMCREHHTIAHAIDVKVATKRSVYAGGP